MSAVNRGGRPRNRPIYGEGPSPAKRPRRDSASHGTETVFSLDRTAFVSTDGRRINEINEVTERHVPRQRHVVPDEFDYYSGYNPSDNILHTFGHEADSPVQTTLYDGSDTAGHANADAVHLQGKRKKYASSDEPMQVWRPEAPTFLRELFYHDARDECMTCGVPRDEDRVVKCLDCEGLVQCVDCCLRNHARLPLHSILQWNEGFWEHCSLKELGHVYQLGHTGFPCPFPEPVKRELVVIDCRCVHAITYRRCNCYIPERLSPVQQLLRNGWWPATMKDPSTCTTFRALELFRCLNVIGNINVNDFVRSLEKLSDPTETRPVPSRTKEFMRATRQHSFIMRVRRGGRAHTFEGMEKTRAGELAELCWACPHPGINLPSGWQEVPEVFRFIYMLILSQDANFRLKNKIRRGEKGDADLGNGWSYMVERNDYKAHLCNYAGEEDISDCVAFAALAQRDSRLTTGLRVSGVGGCFCARHGVLRPLGMGDLQKGERWANMDYIFFSAIMATAILWILITYDVACQWQKRLKVRMVDLPPSLHLRDEVGLRFATPAWHGKDHRDDCYELNVVTFQDGAATTDGEGPEREWSILNPSAFATKEMGEMARQNFIEDKLDHIIWTKNLSQEMALPKKLYIALEEREIQVRNFMDIDELLDSETRESWMAMVAEWAADKSKPNPYAQDRTSHESEQQVRTKLTQEENKEAREGRAPLRALTMTGWITVALEIETAQRRIRAERDKTIYVDPLRADKAEERQHSLLKKINKFREVGQVYCPGLVRATAIDDDERDFSEPTPNAEDLPIYLPSRLPAFLRQAGCIGGLVEKEIKLRKAQAADALDEIRKRLHTRDRLVRHRNANVIGQNDTTRSATLIRRVFDRALLAARKYEAARIALVALEGRACSLHPLNEKTDLTSNLGLTASISDAQRRMNAVSTGGSHVPAHVPTLRAQTSWIWTVNVTESEEDPSLNAAIRWEWARAFARRNRWCEEVLLLREEMRRVLRFMRKREELWSERAANGWGGKGRTLEGLKAYARKQACLYRRMLTQYTETWSKPVKVGEHKDRKPKILPVSAIRLQDESYIGQSLA